MKLSIHTGKEYKMAEVTKRGGDRAVFKNYDENGEMVEIDLKDKVRKFLATNPTEVVLDKRQSKLENLELRIMELELLLNNSQGKDKIN